jgi:hypothetical protein
VHTCMQRLSNVGKLPCSLSRMQLTELDAVCSTAHAVSQACTGSRMTLREPGWGQIGRSPLGATIADETDLQNPGLCPGALLWSDASHCAPRDK